VSQLKLGTHLLLGDELGRGGMGTVFRAEDTNLGRTVAVKLLPEALARDPLMRARLEREARALALLSHPNIVQVFECGEEDGQPYLVMEFVEGKSLSQLLPLSADAAIELGVQLCSALAYAHGKGLIHRDIKPDNVLVESSGHARLADFGVARTLLPDARVPRLTAPEFAAGTPQFLAPEILQGGEADERSDLYSTGVLLYQAITNRLPIGHFEALPGPLDAIVKKALAADPRKRWQSARELGAALETLRAGAGASDELVAEERFLMWGAALVCTAGAAVSLSAALQSITPRVVQPHEMLPLISLVTEALPDGRLVSWCRFETGPVLASAVALAFAFGCLALLRRHWRQSGLDRPNPLLPIAESRWVFGFALVGNAGYWLRKREELHGHFGPGVYAPLLGGLLEVVTLYLFFFSMLQAWRCSRPLRREPLLFLGMLLALLPPAADLVSYLKHWTP
jgi:serine/threonine protein kinase